MTWLERRFLESRECTPEEFETIICERFFMKLIKNQPSVWLNDSWFFG